MKTINKILIGLLAAMLTLTACDPNKELYEQLDAMKKPHNKAIAYALTEADYNSINEPKDDPIEKARVQKIKAHMAFFDTIPAMDYVPAMLARKYLALNLGSSAMVTYNLFVEVEDRPWENVVAGYELTNADYNAMASIPPFGAFVAAWKYFTASVRARDYLPTYLKTLYPSATNGTIKAIKYKQYLSEGNIVRYADVYKYSNATWEYIKTWEEFIDPDYVFVPSDYAEIGYSDPRFPSIAEADRVIPVWLKLKYPYAATQTQMYLYYAYGTGTSTEKAALYTYDGVVWVKSTDTVVEVTTEQYVFKPEGWKFDPTIRFIMNKADYTLLAVNDPIPHPQYYDQGYYFGASGFYVNFDMRLLGFHLRVNTHGGVTYNPDTDDPDLVAIYNTDGPEAATAELFRRIIDEGLVFLLQNKYPKIKPQVGGIDVHCFVGFETYNDNLSRSYLEAEYRCIAPAIGDTPPQFELIEGPRNRQ